MITNCMQAQALMDLLTAKIVRGNREERKSLRELVKGHVGLRNNQALGRNLRCYQLLHACTDADTSGYSKQCQEVTGCFR